jgi:hypothetical protein
MSLSDLKKLAVRRSVNIRFRIADGFECVVTSHGIGRIPTLKSTAGFNLETELAGVEEFVIEPAGDEKQSRRSHRTEARVSRSEIENMVAGASNGIA